MQSQQRGNGGGRGRLTSCTLESVMIIETECETHFFLDGATPQWVE